MMSRPSGVAMPVDPRCGRLLAEAVRALEDDGHHPQPDADAVQLALEHGGGLEERIVVRAKNLPIAPQLEIAIHRMRLILRWVTAGGAIAAFLAGASTVAAVMAAVPRGEPVNFFLALGSVLLVQSLLLLLWLAVMISRPGSAPVGSLGGAIVGVGRRLARMLHNDAVHRAAAHALVAELSRAPLARWVLSSISHVLWLSFNLGALASLLVLLSTRHFVFGWETTILDHRAYPVLIEAVASAPRMIGFDIPTHDQIVASQWTGVEPDGDFEAARKAWSSLLIGSVVCYGLLPRLVAFCMCWWVWRRTCARTTLDLNLPAYASLRDRLMPAANQPQVIDADRSRGSSLDAPRAFDPSPPNPAGSPAIVGLEFSDEPESWPPKTTGIPWIDLGVIHDRAEEDATLRALHEQLSRISQLIVVCELPNTPDRGVQRIVSRFAGAHLPVRILLTAGQKLRDRLPTQELSLRIEDWRAVAAREGISADHVLELDLDHLTDASTAQLQSWLGLEGPRRAERLIDQSFEVISQQAQRWARRPSMEERAELHRAIARLYRNEAPNWRAFLRSPDQLIQDHAVTLKSAAQRMTDLLPPSLRRSARWMATGAAAGALGCVASATLLFPAVITALPLWAGIGAALGAMLPQPQLAESGRPTDSAASSNLQESIDAALLFAIVLELQGRGESEIARVLDAVFHESDSRQVLAAHVRGYVDEVRHRFDLAMHRASRGTGS